MIFKLTLDCPHKNCQFQDEHVDVDRWVFGGVHEESATVIPVQTWMVDGVEFSHKQADVAYINIQML